MEVEQAILTNFKNRYGMRLQLLKTPLGSTVEEFLEIRTFLEKLTKPFLPKTELEVMLHDLEQCYEPATTNIDDLIQELNNLDSATWKELSEFQEKFFSLNIQAYQQSLDFQQKLNTTLQQILKLAVKKPKTAPKKKHPEPVKEDEPLIKYSTPAMKAMGAAITVFCLDFDGQKPPTQKQVSNFIAEKIGEPIRNRFTDEMARAIKPEGI